ncbi:prepilin peptidase [Thalassobius aquimarinus]|uniref:Prepilin peptidase n=2 Tax=Thalassovita aquimarina TaxID=2785917 RepID=A0ABS5HNG7_9RHOB|nr:prepilin peptidase [Thalassovita aquimarina]MBR9650351.1 prepilin peptidase [Thalassovita aquimarina]
MIWVAWHDARHFKIRNTVVLALLVLYLPVEGVLGFQHLQGDLFAGALLFMVGFIMWMLRALGGGDAKLMLPLGMHLGFDGLMPFAMLLMVMSVLLYLGIVLSRVMGAERGIGGWMAGMKETGKVPYGVLLAIASVPVLILNIFMIA